MAKLQHPVPPELLTNIGDITVSFALLVNVLQMLVGALLREDQRIGQIITAELASKNLRALVVSLYKEKHGEDEGFAVVRALIGRAAKAEETRNKITHSIWGAGEQANTITRIKTTAKEKHGIHTDFERVTEAQLAAVAADLQTLAFDVQEFWMSLIERRDVIRTPMS